MTYYRVHSKNISLNNAQNEKPLLERLYIFCNYIKPFLFQRNQFDLIAQTILGLWDITTGFRLSQQRELGIIAVLLTSRVNSSFPAFVEQIDAELPVCQQEHCILVRAVLSRFLDQQQWSRELQNGNTWLSGQIESWQAEVVRQQIASHEQQIWSKELEGGKQWLEAQYQAWMHETRSIQGLYNELQNSYSQLQEAHHQLQEAHYQLQEVHHQLQEAYEFESNRLLKDRILDRVRAILR
jgi:hypothetical protein